MNKLVLVNRTIGKKYTPKAVSTALAQPSDCCTFDSMGRHCKPPIRKHPANYTR